MNENKVRRRKVGDENGGTIVSAFLPSAMVRTLKEIAWRRGEPLSEIIREAVLLYIAEEQAKAEMEEEREKTSPTEEQKNCSNCKCRGKNLAGEPAPGEDPRLPPLCRHPQGAGPDTGASRLEP